MTRQEFQKYYYKAHSWATEKVSSDPRSWGDLLADRFCELFAKEQIILLNYHKEYKTHIMVNDTLFTTTSTTWIKLPPGEVKVRQESNQKESQ